MKYLKTYEELELTYDEVKDLYKTLEPIRVYFLDKYPKHRHILGKNFALRPTALKNTLKFAKEQHDEVLTNLILNHNDSYQRKLNDIESKRKEKKFNL